MARLFSGVLIALGVASAGVGVACRSHIGIASVQGLDVASTDLDGGRFFVRWVCGIQHGGIVLALVHLQCQAALGSQASP